MSYEKAMKHSIRESWKQANNYFEFSTLATDERRVIPALLGVLFESGRNE